MEIKGHDSAFSGERVFRVSGVFDRIKTNEPHSLSKEIVRSKTDCEEVMISRVPTDGGYVLFSLFFVGETPDGQLVSFVFHGVNSFAIGPVVLVVVILLFLVVLHHHSFHNL